MATAQSGLKGYHQKPVFSTEDSFNWLKLHDKSVWDFLGLQRNIIVLLLEENIEPNKEILMGYLAVKDLKKTRLLREKLEKERELVLTKDGQPFALIIGIPPDDVEGSLNEVRRALFSSAVMRARKKTMVSPAKDTKINEEIQKSRKIRGLK